MEFTFVYNGQTLTSPDRYLTDQYGNRFMIFSDASGSKFKISRDALNIDMQTGQCVQRNRDILVTRV